MNIAVFVRVSDSEIVDINYILGIRMHDIRKFKYIKHDANEEKEPFVISVHNCDDIYRTSDAELCSKVFEEVIRTIENGLERGLKIIDLRPVLRIDGPFHTEYDSIAMSNAKDITDEVKKIVEKMSEIRE